VRRALVVYESMFGNGEAVATAIAEGLESMLPVTLLEVGRAPSFVGEDVALLVVGGPTHAFGLSRPRTRADAASRAPSGLVSRGRGLREWLPELSVITERLAAAAYGTHVHAPWAIARLRTVEWTIERRFRAVGVRSMLPRESFFVVGMMGPLLPGELERARRWGERLAGAAGSGSSDATRWGERRVGTEAGERAVPS
jgi:hypothetical protein